MNNVKLIFAGILVLLITGVFRPGAFAQCPSSISNEAKGHIYFNAYLEDTLHNLTRTESSVRTIYNSSTGNKYDYQLIVSDGGVPTVQPVVYDYSAAKPVTIQTQRLLIPGPTNCGPDVRINSKAKAAMVIFVNNNGLPTLFCQLYVSNISASNYGSLVKWHASGKPLSVYSSASPINQIAIDLDQSDHWVITWTANGEVFGSAGTLIDTVIKWSRNNVQLTDLASGGYRRPSSPGMSNTFKGGDVCIYENMHTISDSLHDTTIVTFLMRDLDSLSAGGSNYGVIVYQMAWKDLYAGKANSNTAMMRQNDGLDNPLFRPQFKWDDISDEHIAVDAAPAKNGIDPFNFCAVYSVNKMRLKSYTHYYQTTAAKAKNFDLTSKSDQYRYANTHPEVAFTGDCITATWNYCNYSCPQYLSTIVGTKLSLDGSSLSKTYMDTNATFVVKTGSSCSTYFQSPSISDPCLQADQYYSGSNFYTFFDFKGHSPCGPGNSVWCECRTYKAISKNDDINISDALPNITTPFAVKVYPVPANNTLDVDFGHTGYAGQTELTISNMTGTKLISYTLHGDGVKQIGLGTLPTGIYFITLLQDNKVVTRQIVVARN